MAIDHVSLYQLTIEQGTAFGDRYNRGRLRGLPDEDLGADMYAATQSICAEMGMPAYEVSNHARKGAASLHNLIYWRYGDYVGIGPGAHGRLTLNGRKHATEAFSNPQRWLDGVATSQTERPRMILSARDQAQEFLLMGLRLKEGIDLDRYARIAGERLPAEKILHLADLGMISIEGSRLIVLDQGVIVLNAITEALLPD
jgi:oxygen-independent coproporphyrinogen-3 oxidase